MLFLLCCTVFIWLWRIPNNFISQNNKRGDCRLFVFTLFHNECNNYCDSQMLTGGCYLLLDICYWLWSSAETVTKYKIQSQSPLPNFHQTKSLSSLNTVTDYSCSNYLWYCLSLVLITWPTQLILNQSIINVHYFPPSHIFIRWWIKA